MNIELKKIDDNLIRHNVYFKAIIIVVIIAFTNELSSIIVNSSIRKIAFITFSFGSIIVILFTLLKPKIGILAFMATFLLLPKIGSVLYLPGIRNISIANIIILILSFSLAVNGIFLKKFRIYYNRQKPDNLLLIYILYFLVCSLYGQVVLGYSGGSIKSQIAMFGMQFIPIVIIHFVVSCIDDFDLLEKCFKFMIISSIVPSVIAYLDLNEVEIIRYLLKRFYWPSNWDFFQSYGYNYTYRSSSLFGTSPNLAGFLIANLAIASFSIYIFSDKTIKKNFWLIIYSINIVGVITTGSKTNFLLLIFATSLILLFSQYFKGAYRKRNIIILKHILYFILITIVCFYVVKILIDYKVLPYFPAQRIGFTGDFANWQTGGGGKLLQLKEGIRYTTAIGNFNYLFGIGFMSVTGFINDIGHIVWYARGGIFGLIFYGLIALFTLNIAIKTSKKCKELRLKTELQSIPITLMTFTVFRFFANFGGVYNDNEYITYYYWVLVGLCLAQQRIIELKKGEFRKSYENNMDYKLI